MQKGYLKNKFLFNCFVKLEVDNYILEQGSLGAISVTGTNEKCHMENLVIE